MWQCRTHNDRHRKPSQPLLLLRTPAVPSLLAGGCCNHLVTLPPGQQELRLLLVAKKRLFAAKILGIKTVPSHWRLSALAPQKVQPAKGGSSCSTMPPLTKLLAAALMATAAATTAGGEGGRAFRLLPETGLSSGCFDFPTNSFDRKRFVQQLRRLDLQHKVLRSSIYSRVQLVVHRVLTLRAAHP